MKGFFCVLVLISLYLNSCTGSNSFSHSHHKNRMDYIPIHKLAKVLTELLNKFLGPIETDLTTMQTTINNCKGQPNSTVLMNIPLLQQSFSNCFANIQSAITEFITSKSYLVNKKNSHHNALHIPDQIMQIFFNTLSEAGDLCGQVPPLMTSEIALTNAVISAFKNSGSDNTGEIDVANEVPSKILSNIESIMGVVKKMGKLLNAGVSKVQALNAQGMGPISNIGIQVIEDVVKAIANVALTAEKRTEKSIIPNYIVQDETSSMQKLDMDVVLYHALIFFESFGEDLSGLLAACKVAAALVPALNFI